MPSKAWLRGLPFEALLSFYERRSVSKCHGTIYNYRSYVWHKLSQLLLVPALAMPLTVSPKTTKPNTQNVSQVS